MSTIEITVADEFWPVFLRASALPDTDEDGTPDYTQEEAAKRIMIAALREVYDRGQVLLERDAAQAAAQQERQRQEQAERDLVR